MTTTLRDQALSYVARGWPVIPLRPRGKLPLTPHGLKDAATNPNVIERWWDRWPEANVAVTTGKAMGAFVIDVDGALGSASLTQLEAELGPLPDTLEQATGGGGRHLFFAWPDEREIRNRQAIRPGIDVRGEGGYVVVPPSVHESGRAYMWPCGEKGRIAHLPKAWLDFLCPLKASVPPWERVASPPPPRRGPPAAARTPILERAARYLAECPPAVQGNGGHNALLWAARSMVIGFDLDDQAALELLWREYNPTCQPPWDESNERDRRDFERKVGEARRTPGEKPAGWLLDEFGLRSSTEAMAQIAKGAAIRAALLGEVAKAAIENPVPFPIDDEEVGQAPPVVDRKPFPIDKFPAPVANFVRRLADSHQVDSSYTALPVLAVAAAAMGNAWRIALKEDYVLPPTLWVGLIGTSGSNKTGPLKDVTAPLLTPVPLEQVTEPMVNPQGRIMVGDVTVEAVVPLLRDHPRGLLAFRQEIAGWLNSFGAYKKASGDEQAWLEFWDAGHFQVDRKTNSEHLSVHAASVCVLGGIQPKIFLKCFDSDRFASGLVPRFLIACPPKRRRTWNSAVTVGKEARETWARIVTWLRSRPFSGLDTNRGVFVPHVVPVSIEANAAYGGFFEQLELEKEGMDENCEALVTKIQVMTGRMALVHHGLLAAAQGAERIGPVVGLESMEAATAWARWCLEEQLRVYGYGSKQNREEEALYLIGRIKEVLPTRSATPTQVHRLNSKRWVNTREARVAMGRVVELGYARWADDKHQKIVLTEGA